MAARLRLTVTLFVYVYIQFHNVYSLLVPHVSCLHLHIGAFLFTQVHPANTLFTQLEHPALSRIKTQQTYRLWYFLGILVSLPSQSFPVLHLSGSVPQFIFEHRIIHSSSAWQQDGHLIYMQPDLAVIESSKTVKLYTLSGVPGQMIHSSQFCCWLDVSFKKKTKKLNQMLFMIWLIFVVLWIGVFVHFSNKFVEVDITRYW